MENTDIKVCFLPWPSPWNRQQRKIKKKILRQTRWLHQWQNIIYIAEAGTKGMV
jgi:hypothetical protein